MLLPGELIADTCVRPSFSLFPSADDHCTDEINAGIGIVNDPYEPTLFRDECFIAFVISHLRTEFALPGDLVVPEGTLATAMYFLITGKCQVIGNHGTKAEEVYNTLSDGDHFGEIGVLMQVSCRASHNSASTFQPAS